MDWIVLFHEAFEPEFDSLPDDVQDEILAHATLLERFGPLLGRPRADTLKGSRHSNAGDKSGGSERRFYGELIRKADGRFDAHIARLKGERKT